MAYLGTDQEEMGFKEVQTRIMADIKKLPKDVRNKKKHVLNEPLAQLFGVKTSTLFGVGKYIKKHMTKWVTETPTPLALDADYEEDYASAPLTAASKKRKAPSKVSKTCTVRGWLWRTIC